MSIKLRTQLKVSSVSSIQSPNGKENFRITFVEEHTRPPAMSIMPQNTPKQVSSMVFQVQKGLQQVLPKGLTIQKVVLVFTHDELEAFHIKPYPNQIYEVTITEGNLQFRKTSS